MPEYVREIVIIRHESAEPSAQPEVYPMSVNARAAFAAGLLGVVIGVAALLGLLTSARAAASAVNVRVEVFPSEPRVGDVVTVQLRPFFRSAGSWHVCVLNFSSTGHACVRRSPGWHRVRVLDRNASVDIWHRLQRPLGIQTIAGGSPCPTTAPDPRGDLARIGFSGTAWGTGPAYPALDSGQGKPILRYLDPIPPQSLFHGSKWFGQKVLWAIDSAYRGPLLVRGRQLDGPNELRFDGGVVPPREIRVPSSAAPRSRPSSTRVRAAGCYGYQVDGLGFSSVIVFEAKPSGS